MISNLLRIPVKGDWIKKPHWYKFYEVYDFYPRDCSVSTIGRRTYTEWGTQTSGIKGWNFDNSWEFRDDDPRVKPYDPTQTGDTDDDL